MKMIQLSSALSMLWDFLILKNIYEYQLRHNFFCDIYRYHLLAKNSHSTHLCTNIVQYSLGLHDKTKLNLLCVLRKYMFLSGLFCILYFN
jgi:hypothetical protein